MSVCIEFADNKGGRVEGDQVATNSGWTDFGDWVDTLPLKGYRRVIELWEHGVTFHVAELASQLRRAVKNRKPPKDVRSVAEGVIFLAEKFSWSEGAFVDDGSD